MRIASTIAAAALMLTGVGTAALARQHDSPQVQLAKETEGRVPGKPVRCIDLQRIRNTRIINKTAIVYDAGRTIYVNHPRGGAQFLNEWDIMIEKPFGGQLCSPEIVHLRDTSSHIEKGWVSLGEFVPYTKVRGTR